MKAIAICQGSANSAGHDLERDLNAFLDQNPGVRVRDVKLATYVINDRVPGAIALVLYDEPPARRPRREVGPEPSPAA